MGMGLLDTTGFPYLGQCLGFVAGKRSGWRNRGLERLLCFPLSALIPALAGVCCVEGSTVGAMVVLIHTVESL